MPTASSPQKKSDTQHFMLRVVLAMLPGVATSIALLGIGVLTNLLQTVLFSVAFELLAQYQRQQALPLRRQDGSVLITAILLGLALPPLTPWWILLIASASAILLAKHAYGGLGHNVFNPAMAGYALVLVLFPSFVATHWPAPNASFDGATMATALDVFKQNRGFTVDEWWRAHAQFGSWGGKDWEWINLAFLAGGLFLLQQKIFTWHTPACLLATLALLAALFYDNGSSNSAGSPLYHCFSGATMLGAFFVATDPVTAPATLRARMIYGALIGALIFAIRAGGHYADGIAFAVLLMNAVAPLLDRCPALRQADKAIPKVPEKGDAP